MFDFGEVGYHEYRATQGKGSSKNGPSGGFSILVSIIGCSIGLWLLYFIGCFLWAANSP